MSEALARLSEKYFDAINRAEPIGATVNGVPGYDGEVPDPSREAGEAQARELAGLAAELSAVDVDGLSEEDANTHGMLATLLRDRRADLEGGLHEVSVTATVMGRFSEIIGVVPQVAVNGPEAAAAYLERLGKLGGYFDAHSRRLVEAKGDGRHPVALGVEQVVQQVGDYLDTPLAADPFLSPEPGEGVDAAAWRTRAAELVETVVRPALVRYRRLLAEEIAPVGRDEERVGICHVPGGEEGYLHLARAHTTTDLTPEQLHRTGLDLIASLREEFAELGGKALGTSDTDEVLRRLRTDTSLRYENGEQIVGTVTDVLRRAEEALPGWFLPYDIAPCVVREMAPVEAVGGVLGYYLPPADDGSRPGAHVVNTYKPELRPRFEYEVLAVHESVPGHHLQFAVAQRLGGLPDFRRFAYVTAHSEGWGLYTERLADEMGLYTDDLSRLGMVSFDAWRACRLVVDTGMHAFGWSRRRAIDYMLANTALSEANIVNEVDRYIAAPGQALAYMIGRLRIQELRERAREALGGAFDLRVFHDRVLGSGSVPLGILEGIVDRWVSRNGTETR